MSLPIADSTLETIRSRVKQRGVMRDQRYRKRLAHSLNGLAACRCHGRRPGGRGMHGYRVAMLNQRSGLSGVGEATDVALVPVSDKSAVANAVKYFVAARQHVAAQQRGGISGVRFAGLGDTAQVQGAASMASAGAKAGSIVPGIGTVIGAAVGAVVGWLSAKKKPPRATAEQKAQCRGMLTEYMGYAAQSPNAPLPMEWTQLLDMNWCYAATYGPEIKLNDPRWFNPGFESGARNIGLQIVKKIYETPVGATVNLDAVTFKDPKGRTLGLQKFSFVNPVFTDLKTFSENYFEKAVIKMCEDSGSNRGVGCAAYFSRAEWKRLLYDLLAWCARTTLPNISEADLRAASQVAQSTGTAAKDVVTAVEQIINRNVVKGETSALLTGQTDVPGVVAPTPIAPIPPSTAPPVVVNPNAGTAPVANITPQAAADVTALISQLVAQNASANQATQAALDALKNQGTPITPSVTTAVQKEVQLQQAGGLTMNTALLTGGGILAALFLLARPAKRGR